MNKLAILFLLSFGNALAQPYADAPGTITTTAISKDSAVFLFWANSAIVERGFVYINDTTFQDNGSNRATYGLDNYVLGAAEGDGVTVLSLGDGGQVTLGFPEPITDGPGWDFAVFENSFLDHYMELAFVEVSSNGVDFVRFPSDSKIPTNTQLGNFSTSDCKLVNNLAGKYKAGYGTPFDLNDVAGLDDSVDVQRITHIRIIDVIGTISGEHVQLDDSGDTINDPFPTPYYSSGFDLDAVGVIHQYVGIQEQDWKELSVFPNPSNGLITLQTNNLNTSCVIKNVFGQVVMSVEETKVPIDISPLENGFYFLCMGKNTVKIQLLK